MTKLQKERGLIWLVCMTVMIYYLVRGANVYAQSRQYQYDLGQSVVRIEERLDNHITSADSDLQELKRYRLESDRRITALEGIADQSSFLLRAIAAGIFGIVIERFATWAKRLRRRPDNGRNHENQNDYEE